MSQHLHQTIAAFNSRNFKQAARHAGEGLAMARGRDEAFWMGLLDACEGYGLLAAKDFNNAEPKLIDSMHKLRNFGFRYNEFEITVALAGIRLALEEIRNVRGTTGRVFDVSLLPQLRLAEKAMV